MASTAHKSNRRSFLVGAAIATAGLTSIVPHAEAAQISPQGRIELRAEWDAAMRKYIAAQALADRVAETVGEDEDLDDAADRALAMLIYMPAPDLAALRWKLEFFMQSPDPVEGGAFGYSESYVAMTRMDIDRLMGAV